MDREQVIALAREAGLDTNDSAWLSIRFERFAAFVAAVERERCAKMCDFYAERIGTGNLTGKALIATAFEMRKGS